MENLNRFFIFISLFFVVAVLISACAKTEEVKEAGQTADQAAAKNEAAPSGDAKGILTGLIGSKAPTYMVSYDITGGNDLSKMTMYFKSGKMRYDTEAHGNKSSLFVMDNTIYTCSFEPKMCISLGQQNETPKTGTENVEKNLENYNIVAKPSRTIAGTTAKCFALSNADGAAEACYSSQGVPLYMKSTSQGSVYEMTATDYSTSVSDSAFTLPAEPQDLNALMAKYQQ